MNESAVPLPSVHISDFEPIPSDVISLLPAGLVNKQLVIPLRKENNRLIVAVAKTDGVIKPEGLALVTGCQVDMVLAPAKEITDFIAKHYSGPAPKSFFMIPSENIIPAPAPVILQDAVQDPDPNDTISLFDPETASLLDLNVSALVEPESPAVPDVPAPTVYETLAPSMGVPPEVLKLITDAVISRASEVLLNIRKDKMELRQRLRGTYVSMDPDKESLNLEQWGAVIGWLKTVGEKEAVEDAEWTEFRKEIKIGDDLYAAHFFLTEGKDSKVLTMRLRSQKESVFSPSTWGMDPSQIRILNEFLDRKQGFILFAGAEREGLTGNLHACARHLATPKRHVVAVEPYKESWLSGIDQYFSKGDPVLFNQMLQVGFKHEPDVLVANPLERREQFEMCLSEALKGRLILGRSYASDCADALVQLASMGVEPYLVGSGITAVISKRTLRLNCPVCQTKDSTAKSQAREMGIPDAMQPSCFYVSNGCDTCNHTGFNGETDIFEILSMTTEMRNIFNKDVRVETIRAHIKSSGLLTLRQVALHKAINGQTSLAEVVRTTPK